MLEIKHKTDILSLFEADFLPDPGLFTEIGEIGCVRLKSL